MFFYIVLFVYFLSKRKVRKRSTFKFLVCQIQSVNKKSLQLFLHSYNKYLNLTCIHEIYFAKFPIMPLKWKLGTTLEIPN